MRQPNSNPSRFVTTTIFSLLVGVSFVVVCTSSFPLCERSCTKKEHTLSYSRSGSFPRCVTSKYTQVAIDRQTTLLIPTAPSQPTTDSFAHHRQPHFYSSPRPNSSQSDCTRFYPLGSNPYRTSSAGRWRRNLRHKCPWKKLRLMLFCA